MQIHRKYSRCMAVVAASVLFYAAPVMANDGAIIYAPGTGDIAAEQSMPMGENYAVPRNDAAAELLSMGDKLSDPDMQDDVADMAMQMGVMLMQLPVGKFAAAIEKARPGTMKNAPDADATLADLAGPDAENIPSMLGEHSRSAMTMMSGFASVFASIMPEFEKFGRQMENAMNDIGADRRADSKGNFH